MDISVSDASPPVSPPQNLLRDFQNGKARENGTDHDDDNGSDLSDVEMDDSFSKAGSEQNHDGKEDEDDNSLVVFHCWLCSVEFIDKASIIRHLKEWHKDRPDVHCLERLMKVPVCLECGVQGPCEHQDGERHEEDEGATAFMCRPRFLTCSSCTEQFLNAEAVRLHRAKAHPKEPSHQCTYCPEAFFDHPSLVNHNRIHLGGRPYICTTCGNRFSKISDLKRHERIHSGEKPFKCLQCLQTFTQKSSLEKHARIHARRTGRVACLQCGLLFDTKEELMEHADDMHKGHSFTCAICGKMYSEERYLLLHEKTHNSDNQKPYACSFCDRCFSRQHMLTKHEKKMHLSKREIKCHICHKLFKRNENLTRHMLSHSGVKNFQCSECGVGFTEKGSLTRHFKAQHQQLRPHACPICRRAFTRKSLVRKHVERFHVQKARELVSQRGKFFRCRLCLKLLRKTGKRQHERHHRSKGDVWEGSLEEKLDAEFDGDDNDLVSLLGPEVAKMLTKKKGSGSGGDAADDEEDDNDDDEAAEDKNEDDDDDEDDEENEEDMEEDGHSGDKGSPNEGDMEDEDEDTGEKQVERSRQFDGPVFPEFKHIKANDSDWPKPDAKGATPELNDPREEEEIVNYREADAVGSGPSQGRDLFDKNRSSAAESKWKAQYDVTSDLPSFRKVEAQDTIVSSNKHSQGEVGPARNMNLNIEKSKVDYLAQRLLDKTENQEPLLRQQREGSERNASQSDLRTQYTSLRDQPPTTEDPRLQGFRDPRDSQLTEAANYESSKREERGSSSHHPSEGSLGSYSDSHSHHRSSKEITYMEEAMGTSRPLSGQRDSVNPQYFSQGGVKEQGYQEAVGAYQRMEQESHGSVPDPQYNRESPYQGELKEAGGGYPRHPPQEVETEPARHRNQSEAEEERAYREAASAYGNMVDPRQRNQAGGQGSGVASANLDETRYREAAAAYAMMGIAGYADPRMVGSRSHGQNYLGMYPWYNETALTQAMMESRPQLQGMMGNLGYPGSSSFVDSRLREHHGGGLREDQQYEIEPGQGYGRDATNTYSLEMMNALAARQRDYEGVDHQRYRGHQGDLLAEQYKDASRESRYAPTAQGHGMMRAGHQEEVSGRRDERGYHPGPSSSSHSQEGSIHRSWM